MIEHQANLMWKIIIIIIIAIITIIIIITITEGKMTGVTWFFVLGHNVARLQGETFQTDDDDDNDDDIL